MSFGMRCLGIFVSHCRHLLCNTGCGFLIIQCISQAHHLTPAALGAFVGPALTKVQRTATTSHGGQDLIMAMRFLIHNYGPVFSDYAASQKGSYAAVHVPQATSARRGSGGKKWAQQHVDKRGALQRHSNRPRVNLLKSVQSPGSHRPATAVSSRKQAVHHQQLHASGVPVRFFPAEVCQFISLIWNVMMFTGASFAVADARVCNQPN